MQKKLLEDRKFRFPICSIGIQHARRQATRSFPQPPSATPTDFLWPSRTWRRVKWNSAMEQGNLLALPRTTWETKYLEDSSLCRLVLEYYDREHVAIRRYLFFLSVNAETAQEIVQESFLKLHQHLLANGDRTNLRAWLYRVAHNLGRNAQMAFHSVKTDSLDVDAARQAWATAPSPEEELLEQERRTRLRRAME